MIVGYYYGSLVYADLCRGHESMLKNGKQIIQVTRETLQIWAGHLYESFVDMDSVKHNVCIVSALVRTMCYMTNSSGLSEDEDTELEQVMIVGKCIVDIHHTSFSIWPDGFHY